MRVLLVAEGEHELSGALQTMTRRLMNRECEFDSRRLSDRRVRTLPGRDGRFTKWALAWVRHAVREGFQAIVLLIDHDGDAEREPQITKAQDEPELRYPRAIGVAIRSFDAWMLADEAALTAALGRTTQRQPDPESIRDPKAKCTELRDSAESSITLRELYCRVAERATIEALEQRCPRGFQPFAQRVRALPAECERIPEASP